MLTAIIVVFVIGYLAIAFEHQIHVNKAASAILTGVLCWSIYAIGHQQLVPQAEFDKWERAHQMSVEHDAPTEAQDNKSASASSHLPAKLEFITEYQLPRGFVEIAGARHCSASSGVAFHTSMKCFEKELNIVSEM